MLLHVRCDLGGSAVRDGASCWTSAADLATRRLWTIDRGTPGRPSETAASSCTSPPRRVRTGASGVPAQLRAISASRSRGTGRIACAGRHPGARASPPELHPSTASRPRPGCRIASDRRARGEPVVGLLRSQRRGARKARPADHRRERGGRRGAPAASRRQAGGTGSTPRARGDEWRKLRAAARAPRCRSRVRCPRRIRPTRPRRPRGSPGSRGPRPPPPTLRDHR